MLATLCAGIGMTAPAQWRITIALWIFQFFCYDLTPIFQWFQWMWKHNTVLCEMYPVCMLIICMLIILTNVTISFSSDIYIQTLYCACIKGICTPIQKYSKTRSHPSTTTIINDKAVAQSGRSAGNEQIRVKYYPSPPKVRHSRKSHSITLMKHPVVPKSLRKYGM